MKSIIQVGVILGICAVLAIAMGSGGDSKPKPTPVPVVVQDDTAATVAVVVQGYEPLVKSSAGAVDTLAELANPDPAPSFYETWGVSLVALCIVGMVIIAVVILGLAWIVARSGVLVKLVHALERWGEQ